MKTLLEYFRPMSVEALARQELEAAQRKLLAAETGLDFARAMVAYHTDRIDRLKGILNGLELRNQKADAEVKNDFAAQSISRIRAGNQGS